VAAGAAQPDAVPGVEDFAGSNPEEHETHDRESVRPKARPIVVEDTAAADDPGGMLATAAERPAPGNAVAAIHDHGLPHRSKCTAGDDERVAAVDLARCVWREISSEHAVFAADRDAPAHCAIRPRDLFDNPDQGHRVGLLAAQFPRNP
jgi:hypothetical protein